MVEGSGAISPNQLEGNTLLDLYWVILFEQNIIVSLGLLDGGMIRLMCSVRDVLKTVSTLIQDGFGFSQRVGSSSVEPL